MDTATMRRMLASARVGRRTIGALCHDNAVSERAFRAWRREHERTVLLGLDDFVLAAVADAGPRGAGVARITTYLDHRDHEGVDTPPLVEERLAALVAAGALQRTAAGAYRLARSR